MVLNFLTWSKPNSYVHPCRYPDNFHDSGIHARHLSTCKSPLYRARSRFPRHPHRRPLRCLIRRACRIANLDTILGCLDHTALIQHALHALETLNLRRLDLGIASGLLAPVHIAQHTAPLFVAGRMVLAFVELARGLTWVRESPSGKRARAFGRFERGGWLRVGKVEDAGREAVKEWL